MNQQIASTTAGNGESTPHDLFALTDEQILEIEPEAQDLRPQPNGTASAVISSEARYLSSSPATDQVAQSQRDSSSPSAPRNDGVGQRAPDTAATSHNVEPPPWLAAQMKDPWSGEEARELWNGVQQAQSEAAAYRAAFANPEDARALKELYPGGVTEARAAAERARVLDDIDRSYFGVTGKSAEEVSATRAELAQRMMREDPAAFREMVFAGLRVLENAGVGATPSSRAEARDGSPGTNGGVASAGGASPVPTTAASSGRRDSQNTELQTRDTGHEAHLAAYSAFEKAANEDLERSVGGAIERTLAQALPNVGRNAQDASIRTGQAPPVQARLNAAIRQDVETALKGD